MYAAWLHHKRHESYLKRLEILTTVLLDPRPLLTSRRQSEIVKPTVPATKGASPRPLNQADLAVLTAVKRFHYLTAAQVSRLLYPDCHDDNRYARRRLARLADINLLLRLTGPPAPRYGSAPHVFTLGRAGRQLLDSQDTYFRPAEERAKSHNFLFMDHTLATVDVLVAVSYTHLRAHETDSYLVCRLL